MPRQRTTGQPFTRFSAFLLGGRFVRTRNRNAVYELAARLAPMGGAGLVLRRARTTWLAAHIEAGTGLAVLRAIAGPVSPSTLTALMSETAAELDPLEGSMSGTPAMSGQNRPVRDLRAYAMYLVAGDRVVVRRVPAQRDRAVPVYHCRQVPRRGWRFLGFLGFFRIVQRVGLGFFRVVRQWVGILLFRAGHGQHQPVGQPSSVSGADRPGFVVAPDFGLHERCVVVADRLDAYLPQIPTPVHPLGSGRRAAGHLQGVVAEVPAFDLDALAEEDKGS